MEGASVCEEVVVLPLRWIECPHDDQSGHLNEQQGIEHPLLHEAAATAASGTLAKLGHEDRTTAQLKDDGAKDGDLLLGIVRVVELLARIRLWHSTMRL